MTISFATETRWTFPSWTNSTPTALLLLSNRILVAVELSIIWRFGRFLAGRKNARAVESREPFLEVVWAIANPV